MKKHRKILLKSLGLIVASFLCALVVNSHSVGAIGYKNWPQEYKNSWKIKTLSSSELQLITKYYPSSSGNSSKCPGRKNGVGTICYPTTYYGQGGTITKNYFAFSVFNGDSGSNYIYFADRKSPYKIKKTIGGNWGHMNSFYYSWDSNAFKVDGTNKCYSGTKADSIFNMIRFTVNVLAIGITVLSTIGIIWSGVLILTARDNVAQVTAAKNRIYDIVIGLVLWGILAIGINLILPDGSDALTGLF